MQGQLDKVLEDFTMISGDASFRRYFRGKIAGSSYIGVDAPPSQEDSRSFVAMSALLADHQINVPIVLAEDFDLGFMLLTDLGDELFFSAIARESGTDRQIKLAHELYGDAFGTLITVQNIPNPGWIEPYDEKKLVDEISLFPDWFIAAKLGLDMSTGFESCLSECTGLLVRNALIQPQVLVHRDYHCRNLMICDHNPGVLDFQDAVIGAITYDLVSLLRDCYLRWPPSRVEAWALSYRDAVVAQELMDVCEDEVFIRWFDLMGLQRHLKCAGIFSRLNLRDGKAGYVPNIPLVVDYILEICGKYPEFHDLGEYIRTDVVAGMASTGIKPL